MAGAEFKNGYKKGFEDGANSVEEGLPGWFGTFADMMTLLFAFFVLLAAISTMDPVKLQEMANSEGKSLGSKIKASGKAEEEGEFEPIKNLAEMKKEMEAIIAQIVELNYLNPNLNMKVVLVGHLFFNHCQMFLKQKRTIC